MGNFIMNKKLLNYLICPSCGHDKLTLNETLVDGVSIVSGALICPNCSKSYPIESGVPNLLPPKFNDTSLQEADDQKVGQKTFFDGNAIQYEKEVADSPYYKALDETIFFKWVDENLDSDNVIFELGCGTGRQCLYAAKSGIYTIGIDISAGMVSIGAQKASKDKLQTYVDFILADAENPPLKRNIFDACIIVGTLHHLENPKKALSSAASKLKTHSKIFTYDPHKSPVRFLFDLAMLLCKLYDEEASNDPLFSVKRINTIFSSAGFDCNVKVSTYLLPHLFYLFNHRINCKLLKLTDQLFSPIPVINRLGGMIVVEGTKSIK